MVVGVGVAQDKLFEFIQNIYKQSIAFYLQNALKLLHNFEILHAILCAV